MQIENYPKMTVIMRGYSFEEAMIIIEVLTEYHHKIGVEVTTNNPDYLKIIKEGNLRFGDLVDIGVGTVLTLEHAKEAIQAGAKFMLGPGKFTKEIFEIARKNHVITVPAAMTPSEVSEMFNQGADIVKVFPAATVGSSFFKQIQGPYGKLNLMAVGGVELSNVSEFLNQGAKYVGIGSSMFNKNDCVNQDKKGIRASIDNYLEAIQKVGEK